MSTSSSESDCKQQHQQSSSKMVVMPAVHEESEMVLNQNSFSRVVEEAKASSIIFDSYASLDDPNGGGFGLALEAVAGSLVSESCKQSSKISPSTGSVSSSSPPSVTSADEEEATKTNNNKDSKPLEDDNTKPKRPLAAYNLFFQLERERLIAGTTHVPFTEEDVKRIADARRIQMMSDSQPKRKHRKSHGKISFAELARVIASNWKALKPHEKDLLRERAAIEKASYLKELEEWTKKTNKKEIERRLSFGSYHHHHQQQQQQQQQPNNGVDRPERRSPSTPQRSLPTQSSVWQHEQSIAQLDDQHQSAPTSPFTMPPPAVRTPVQRNPSAMWQYEDSIASLQDAPPQPPLWRSPSSVMDSIGTSVSDSSNNDCLVAMSSEIGGMSMMSMGNHSNLPLSDHRNSNNCTNDKYNSGAVLAFQDDEDFCTMREQPVNQHRHNSNNDNNIFLRRKFNFAPMHQLQQQRLQQRQDYVSMFQKMDVHDTGMHNMMMMQQHQQHYEPSQHQMSLRHHISYGATYQQQLHQEQQQRQQQHTMMMKTPVIDTQRRVRRPRRRSVPTEQQCKVLSCDSAEQPEQEEHHLGCLLSTLEEC